MGKKEEQIIDKCEGCQNVRGKYCDKYMFPFAKWRGYDPETGEGKCSMYDPPKTLESRRRKVVAVAKQPKQRKRGRRRVV